MRCDTLKVGDVLTLRNRETGETITQKILKVIGSKVTIGTDANEVSQDRWLISSSAGGDRCES